MAWGIKYTSDFDAIAGSGNYSIVISEKDYTGDPTVVIASGIPVLHQWQTDDPKAPIKGSSLSISLINQNGSLPLSSFFSTDDDQFKVQFYWGLQLLFEGFLVQDDCSEIMVDYTHEINLSATDGLGLLKDIPLDKAKIVFELIATVNDTWSLTAPHTLTLPAGIAALVAPGDRIEIHNVIFDVTYHVTDADGTVNITVEETVTTGAPGGSDDIEVYHPKDFDLKVTLAFFLENCLWATGLELNTFFFCNFLEVNHDPDISFIEQTLQDPNTYQDSDGSFKNCYDILWYIMKRFRCSCFQSRGAWYIVHWDELRYEGYPIPGYYYDADFALLGTATLDNGFNMFQIGVGEDTVAETGLLHRVFRPLLFDKETFNYQTPGQLIRNSDLQILGYQFDETIVGDLKKTYYRFPASSLWEHIDTDDSYIVVETDTTTDNEITRYVEQPVTDSTYPVTAVPVTSLKFNDIEVGEGDKWDLSFQYRWANNSGDYGLLNIGVFVLPCPPNFYNLNDAVTSGGTYLGWGYGPGSGSFIDGYGNLVSVLTLQADDKSEWQTVSLSGLTTFPGKKMPTIPEDGIMKIYIYGSNSRDPGEQTDYTNENFQFKDIKLDYTFYINESTKITGQTHQTEQDAVIKQTEENGIFIDDSPRNAIAGTLFMPSLTCDLQDRTTRWNIDSRTDKRLGDLTTYEQEYWRRIVRSILEGTFHGLISADTGGDHVSMLSVFNYTFFPGLIFVAGTMEIDYRNNRFSGTLWEICTDTEVNADLIETYIFKYLYSTK